MKRNGFPRAAAVALAVSLALASTGAAAHCDGVDGPVAAAAGRALDDRDVSRALIWVKEDGAAEIRAAFDKALAARGSGAAAKALADGYFAETVVRVHRAGEGAPYTGLKPAGRDLGPAIPAADKALAGGSVEPVAHLLTDAVNAGMREHFRDVIEKSGYDRKDVEAGRRYVAAYVDYVHYVERVYEAGKKAGGEEHHAAASGH